MIRSRTLLALAAVTVLLAAPAAAKPKTVKVDCTKGQSIQAALASKGDPLTVEITGICVENVTVRRDNVTFLGADPALDGIRAASVAESFSAAVIVRESRNIRFENLQFAGGRTAGLRVENARRNISADNCLFQDNGTWGAIAVGGTLQITNSTVRDNHTSGNGGGITAAESGQLTCDGCTIVDNPDPTDGTGANARTGGIVNIASSVIDGVRTGLIATIGGEILISSSDISADNAALAANDQSTLLADTCNIEGRVFVSNKSRMQLFDVAQISTPAVNVVDTDSLLEVFAGAPGSGSFVDTLIVSGFSKGSSFGFTSFTDISCDATADFRCDGLETKTSSSCGLCP